MVYFIRSVESNRIKIGYTNGSVSKRLATLQTGCPEPLELLHFTEEAGPYEEAKIHRRFKDYRVRGEWFSMNDEIECFIRVLKTRRNQMNAIYFRPENLLEQEQLKLLIEERKGVRCQPE